MGVVCAGGSNCEDFAKTLLRGAQCFAPLDDSRLAKLKSGYAGLVRTALPVAKNAGAEDRHISLARYAARQAVAQAALTGADCASRTGLFLGTCSGPMLSIESFYEKQLAASPLGPGDVAAKSYGGAARAMAAEFDVRGPVVTVTTACSASAGALGAAADLISAGAIDRALVGGADAFSPTTLAGFEGLKAVCEGFCAPFSKPAGLNLGEGSGFVVLETGESARTRGAAVLARLLGYGSSNDAHHRSAPDAAGRGQAYAIERAVRHAGVNPRAVGYINAHGTGTLANDKAETKAMLRVFDLAWAPPVSSTKSMIGHCLGAAGIVELIASIICARKGFFPPTAGFSEPREGCVLDYIDASRRPWNKKHLFMANSFAFGGNNVSLIASADADAAEPSEAEPAPRGDPIVISACGVVSPAGVGCEALLEALYTNRAPLEKQPFLRVPAFQERSIDRRLNLRDMDCASRYASVAAKRALVQAGIPEKPKVLDQLGLYLGHTEVPLWAERDHITHLLRNDFQITRVHTFPSVVPNSVAGNVSRALMLRGHNLAFYVPSQGGLQTLAMAAAAIANDHAEAILAGTVDEITEEFINEQSIRGSGAPETWSEGAAMFLLERLSSATRRAAAPLAALSACAIRFFCVSQTAETELEILIDESLEKAQIGAENIAAVCRRHADAAVAGALRRRGLPLDRLYDLEPRAGFAKASGSLFSAACALADQRLEINDDKNYILSIYQTPPDGGIALIFRLLNRKTR